MIASKDDIYQIVHQFLVWRINAGLYSCTLETGILFNVVIKIEEESISTISASMKQLVMEQLQWEHVEPNFIPSEIN